MCAGAGWIRAFLSPGTQSLPESSGTFWCIVAMPWARQRMEVMRMSWLRSLSNLLNVLRHAIDKSSSRKTVIFVRALLLDAIEFRIEIRAIHRSSMILVDCKCGGHPGCRRVSPLNHQFTSFANKAEAPVFIRRTQPHQKPFTSSYWAL